MVGNSIRHLGNLHKVEDDYCFGFWLYFIDNIMKVRHILLGQGIQPSKLSVSKLKFYLVPLLYNLEDPGGIHTVASFSYFIFVGILTFEVTLHDFKTFVLC